MKRKLRDRRKRIVSLICAIAMVMTSFAHMPAIVTHAAGAFTVEESETDTLKELLATGSYTEVTPEKFGITEPVTKVTGENQQFVYSSNVWNKKVFHGQVKFSKNSTDRLFFGHAAWNGIYFWGNSAGNISIGYNTSSTVIDCGAITVAEMDGKTLTDEYIDLAVSFEIVESGTLRVGIFIDEKLCEGGYLKLTGVNTDIFGAVQAVIDIRSAGSTISIAPKQYVFVEPSETDTLEELIATGSYTEINPEAFGITEATTVSGTSKLYAPTGSPIWENKVFHGQVKFSTNESDRIYFGHTAECGLYLHGNAQGNISVGYKVGTAVRKVGEITVEEMNGKTLTGEFVDLAVSIKVTGDSHTGVGEAVFGIFIDGQLCEGGYLRVTEINTEILRYAVLKLDARGLGTGISIAPIPPKQYVFVEPSETDTLEELIATGNYTEVTPETFGITEATTVEGTSQLYAPTGSPVWENKVFHGQVKFSTNENDRIYFGHAAQYGLYLHGNGQGNISVGYKYGTAITEIGEITSEEMNGKTLTGELIDLAVSIKVTGDSSKGTGEAVFGIFIDGALCEGGYLRVTEINTEILKYVVLKLDVRGLGTGISISPIAIAEDLSQITLEDMYADYQTLTFSDFAFIDGNGDPYEMQEDKPISGSYWYLGTHTVNGTAQTGSWDNYIFRGKIKFGNANDSIYIGRQQWQGISIWGVGNDLKYTLWDTSESKSGTILASSADKTTLVREYVDFAISFDIVTASSSASAKDGTIKIGFFIDGKLVDEFVEWSGVNTNVFETRKVFMRGASGYGTAIISVDNEALEAERYQSAETITLSDFKEDGVAVADTKDYDIASGSPGGVYDDTLIGKKVSMILDFNVGEFLNFGADQGTWGGLQFKWESEQMISITVVPSGKTPWNGPELLVAATNLTRFTNAMLFEVLAEPADFDLDGKKDDLLLRIYFNGELYDGKPLCIYGDNGGDTFVTSEFLTSSLYFHHYSSAPISFYSVPNVAANGSYVDVTQADFEFDGVQGETQRSDITGAVGTIRKEFASGVTGARMNMDVFFPADENAKFYYGTSGKNAETNEFEDGIVFYGNSEGSLVIKEVRNNVEIAEIPNMANKCVNLKFVHEKSYTLQDSAINIHDKLILWINNEIYDTDILDEKDYLVIPCTVLGNGIASVGTADHAVITTIPQDSIEPKEELMQYTMSDLAMVKSGTGKVSTVEKELLNSVFTMNTKLTAGNWICYAGMGYDSGWDGLKLNVTSADEIAVSYWNNPKIDGKGINTSLGNLTSAIAGTEFTDKYIVFSFSVEEVDFDRDGVKDDLVIGIFVNGKLYNNRYYYMTVDGQNLGEEAVGSKVGLWQSSGTAMYSDDYTDARLASYIITTPNNYNIADGSYNAEKSGILQSVEGNLLTMDGKVFHADVKLQDDGKITLGEIELVRNGDKLALTDIGEVDWKKSVLTSLDKKFDLKLAVSYVDRDATGGANDVQIAIWIEDTFIGYYYADNCATDMGSSLKVNKASVISPKTDALEGYTEYILEDFGFQYREYRASATGSIVDLAKDEIIYTDKLQLKGDVTATVGGYSFTVKENELTITAGNDTVLTIPQGEKASFGFVLEQELVDADKDGSVDDVQLTVTVDGTSYVKRSFWLLNRALNGNGAITITNGTISVKEIYEHGALPVEVEEGYVLSDDESTTITVNYETVEPGTILNKAGVYRITYTKDGQSTTQVVAIYKTGDANADNQVDARDLVALKKASVKKDELTKAGEKGADLDGNGELSSADVDLIRELLVGKKTAETVREEFASTQFGVISDIHYIDSDNGHREENLRKVLHYYREQGVKLIIMNGDLSDLGTEKSYQNLVKTFREVYPDEDTAPTVIATSDNHEYYDAWEWLNGSLAGDYDTVKERFLTHLANPLGQEDINTCVKIDGYTFIGVSSDSAKANGVAGVCDYSEATKSWLREKLAAAAQEDSTGTKPIFVAIHQPLKDTVINGANDGLNAILADYPQAVVFTSHTHSSMKLEGNIHQKDFTTVNTSSLYYAGKSGKTYENVQEGYYAGYMKEAFDFGEGFLVTVNDKRVIINRYDIFNNTDIKEPWVITRPEKASDFTSSFQYTSERNKGKAPVFASETPELGVKKITDTSVKLTFDVASSETDIVYYYKVNVTPEGGTTKTYTYCNGYFLGADRMDDSVSYIVDGLTEGVKYTFSVTAYDSYEQASGAITTDYTIEDEIPSIDPLELVDFIVEVEEGREPVVLQLSDTQIIDAAQMREGRTGVNTEYWATDKINERLYDSLDETIEATNPDLILITGDVVYGEFDDNGTALLGFIEKMESYGIPWAPVFGNHDNESAKGVDWQCEQFEKAEHCLFKQRTMTGNGNYVVGIKQGDVLKRVFFMMDSNGCGYMHANSLANGHSKETDGFGQDQMDWSINLAQKIKRNSPDTKISYAFHIQISAFADAYAKYGFTNTNTANNPINIDKLENKEEGDFGYIGRDMKNPWDTNHTFYNRMKEVGVDSIFVGHEHCNSASVVYDGIRFQYAQKIGTYDRANFVTSSGEIQGGYCLDYTNDALEPMSGGTVMKLSETDGTIAQAYIYLCGEAQAKLDGTYEIPEGVNGLQYGAELTKADVINVDTASIAGANAWKCTATAQGKVYVDASLVKNKTKFTFSVYIPEESTTKLKLTDEPLFAIRVKSSSASSPTFGPCESGHIVFSTTTSREGQKLEYGKWQKFTVDISELPGTCSEFSFLIGAGNVIYLKDIAFE